MKLNELTLKELIKLKSDIEEEIEKRTKTKETDSTIVFEKIISQLKEKILKNNLENITEELLMFCIQIIVTDAFVRCKIFENPEGYKYVASR